MSNKLNTGKKLQAFKNNRVSLAKKIANDAVNFFKVDVFDAQGFIDNSTQRWQPKKKGAGKILVKTGRGRRSIRANSITNDKIKIQANAPYMKYHNEGTKHLPKRQFMGNSARLNKKIEKRIFDFLDNL